MMRGVGGTPPPPPGYRPPPLPGVAPGPSSGIFRGRLVVVQGTGTNTGLFVYSGQPGLGNSPIFWAPSASTDPFGNVLPSTAGVAGAGQFDAGNTIINANGTFVYSGTPSSANLIVSECPAATTDPFGTAAVQGVAAYVTISGTRYAIRLGGAGASGTIPGFFSDNLNSPAFASPSFGPSAVGPGGCSAEVASGQSLAGSVASGIFAQDSTLSGIVNGLVALIAGQVQLGNSGLAVWDDNAQSLGLPASGGPFITGESFHAVSLAAGLSGTLRVKLLPWNAIWIDLFASISNTNTTFTLGSLPSAAYYPTSQRRFPVANTTGATAWLFVPTSGALQLLLGAASSGGTAGLSTMYPTN
jgi:hypothetical protein